MSIILSTLAIVLIVISWTVLAPGNQKNYMRDKRKEKYFGNWGKEYERK